MIYRNSEQACSTRWARELNPDGGTIAREFLAGELDLMLFTRSSSPVTEDLAAFLAAASELEVYRSDDGDLLIRAVPWSDSLLLTGRTAHVLCSYLDSQIVRMEDRFDMTVRHAAMAV
jgi:hypothetical protein